jgi:hypothetical protein
MHTMEEQEAEQAGEPRAAVPDGEEIGLKTARTVLGKLTARADLRDEVTYLTNSGTREAAIVPADAARTRAQLAAERQAAPAPNDELLAEITRLRTKLIGLQIEHTRRLDAQELYWAEAVLGLWEIMAHMARAAGREHELSTFSLFEIKRKHAEEILTTAHRSPKVPDVGPDTPIA